MFKNYLTTALRNFWKNKLFSSINIGGLALGIAACLLIFLFIKDELGYESWLPNNDNIYRVETTYYFPGSTPIDTVVTPGPLKAALEKGFFSEIETATRLFVPRLQITKGERQFFERVGYVDVNFFDVFPLKMIVGNAKASVANTSSIILSETTATKYFGDQEAVGQVLTLVGLGDVKVVGVFEDIPEKSHLRLDMVTLLDEGNSMTTGFIQNWASSNLYSYVKLKEGVNIETIRNSLEDFVSRNVAFDVGALQQGEPTEIVEFHLMPVTDIHLKSERSGNLKEGGDIVAVYTFSVIAGFILLIACFNFMNLASARAIQRAREVSLRKVVGATRKQLIQQFLSETILTVVMATFLALLLVEISLPWYNGFLGKTLVLSFFSNPSLLFIVSGLVVLVGLFGGTYPAFFLSSYKPAEILKSNKSSSEGSPTFRNLLVFFQFSISIGLIISTAVVYGQAVFARNIDLGFEHKNMIVIGGLMAEEVSPSVFTLKEELLKLPGVKGATLSTDIPPLRHFNSATLELPDMQTENQMVIEKVAVDASFFQTMGVESIAGRVFSDNFTSDLMKTDEETKGQQYGVVINESAIRQMGFGSAEEAVGRTFRTLWGENNDLVPTTVVGVVPDLRLRSVRHQVGPTIFYSQDGYFRYLIVKTSQTQFEQVAKNIDAVWENIYPGIPIRRTFMEDNFSALYDEEVRSGNMLAGFSGFAIFVASLGLFGLAAFAAEKRTKEIGIRKVLGATIADIVKLLTAQFSKPVLLANLLAWPIAWYFMNDWLNGFVYRISLNPLFFIFAGILALLIAWATISSHAFRVAKTNPIHALRTE